MSRDIRLKKEIGPIKPVKLYKTRLPIELRRHPGFKEAQIRVDGDQVCFYLKDALGNPEIWAYNTLKDGWANVQFLADAANPQV